MAPAPLQSLHYQALASGPSLIILGAVHGNETCGTQAIRRLIAALDSGEVELRRGRLTLVPVCNPLAYAHHRRMGERNLNRNLYPCDDPQVYEDHVANWLCPLLAEHEVLLDLHSFHTPGAAFAMLGPQDNGGELQPFTRATQEEELARRLGVTRFVDGWLETYARGVERRRLGLQERGCPAAGPDVDARYGVGTTEYMRTVGGCGLTLECGQHDDPAAPELAWRAILNTLAWLGLSGDEAPPPIAAQDAEMLRLFEVVDKEHEDDAFVRLWASFDAVAVGELIGRRHDGREIRAEADVRIVFPNPGAAVGQEWFYLARSVQRFR